MQVTETLNEGLKRKLDLSIPATELSEQLDAKLNELKDRVQLKGFRPGKVPFAHLKKVYGRAAMSEVMQEAINSGVQKTLDEREERAALQPQIDLPEDQEKINKVFDGDADLAFTVTYEVLPKIELMDFKKISVTRPVIEVPEEEIQEQLDRVVESNTPYEAAPEGTKAENGHKVMMNFLGKIDGEPFDGGKAENTPIVLGSGQFIPGFEEQIIGVKAGENKTIEVTFPDDYRAEHLAGKTAQFDVEVLSVEVPGKVEVNDEFAQQLGVESVEKLREAIRDSIQSEYDKLTERRVKRLVLDALDDAHKFDVPEQLVEQEFNSIWERVKHEIEHHGRSFEDEGTTEEDARKDYQRIAERRVRLGLVVAEIGSKNEIQVTEDEHKQALMAEVQRFPGQEQEVYDYYLKNQNALQSLRAPIFESKVIAFVTELADVKDETVTKDELIKMVEEDNEDEVPEAHVHHDHDHDHHDHDHDH